MPEPTPNPDLSQAGTERDKPTVMPVEGHVMRRLINRAGFQHQEQKAVAEGYASLDATGKVPVAQLPLATTTGTGIVQLAEDNDATVGEVVQGSDPRLAAVSTLLTLVDQYNMLMRTTAGAGPMEIHPSTALMASFLLASTTGGARSVIEASSNTHANLHSAGESMEVQHNNLAGLTTGDPHTQYALEAAGAFTAQAPTSTVAATDPSHLTRKNEMDADIGALGAAVVTALGGKQALHDNLTSQSALTPAADRLDYWTGSGPAGLALTVFTAFARTLLDDADSAAARSTLADGSASTGTGGLVRATSPALVTPALGTPTALVLTSATGLPTAGLVDDAVTYAKLQNVSATNRVLGRSTAGAGNAEEIPCTADARTFLNISGATGDLLYYTGSAWRGLPAGGDGQSLRMNGGIPEWQD